eukprot:CAMPEP_0202906988 /NCGR_PEP_ID=MMETSP1392-20130828/40936_1 /ASSEMBLY_ACC=CAM_ASM_000868 /TAXON_ID=225041 /ORGANISM="Chlamydomonas chlamydogama, Strain SAG 11-48b" /LENGTH=135 /DNA_ID=CAMNT_0049595703 /DNA_START=256 /DNA_END=663 /DNA_ORIENTATION=+
MRDGCTLVVLGAHEEEAGAGPHLKPGGQECRIHALDQLLRHVVPQAEPLWPLRHTCPPLLDVRLGLPMEILGTAGPSRLGPVVVVCRVVAVDRVPEQHDIAREGGRLPQVLRKGHIQLAGPHGAPAEGDDAREGV